MAKVKLNKFLVTLSYVGLYVFFIYAFYLQGSDPNFNAPGWAFVLLVALILVFSGLIRAQALIDLLDSYLN